MGVQFIETPAGRFAVLPEAEYQLLSEALEDAEAAAIFDRFQERLAAGKEELIPDTVVNRILGGEAPVRVWREHRGMKAGELAAAAGISQAYLSQIETGKRDGSVSALKAIAAVLRVTLDDIVG